jgi:glutathione S-transferase
MKLYCDPITVNCRKVLAGFDLMGAQFKLIKLNYFAGDQRKPEYLAINPNGMLPSLVDEDFVLWESNAILQYVADKIGATSVYPKDAKTRADINRWQLWESSRWAPCCYVYLNENVGKPLLGAKPDNALIEAQTETFRHLAGILEQRLANQSWLCGHQVTLADIAVAASIHVPRLQRLPMEPHPHLLRWLKQLEALPCWKRTNPAPLLGLE